jgi:hypothetical protein
MFRSTGQSSDNCSLAEIATLYYLRYTDAIQHTKARV